MRCLLLLLGACGFSAHAAPDASFPDLIDAPRHDADLGPDASVIFDAAPTQQFMLANSNNTLYAVDVDQGTATALGTFGTYSVYALAGDATTLLGIPSGENVLLTIDPQTGAVQTSHPLAPKHDYYGFAHQPATSTRASVWYAATDGAGEPDGNAPHLYAIDTTAGTTTSIGQLDNGLSIAGDLAWVEGKGLYGTFYGPNCMSETCIAKVNTSDASTTVITTQGPTGALALSGFRGQLWALDTSGNVWSVDTTNGNATFAFSTLVQWSDAAN